MCGSWMETCITKGYSSSLWTPFLWRTRWLYWLLTCQSLGLLWTPYRNGQAWWENMLTSWKYPLRRWKKWSRSVSGQEILTWASDRAILADYKNHSIVFSTNKNSVKEIWLSFWNSTRMMQRVLIFNIYNSKLFGRSVFYSCQMAVYVHFERSFLWVKMWAFLQLFMSSSFVTSGHINFVNVKRC